MAFVIGLIGGIASGKSTVARMLQARGGLWLDADKAAHAILHSPEVTELVAQRFGRGVLDANGQVDRARMAQAVFGSDPSSTAHLEWLEQTIHPRVRQHTQQRIVEEGNKYRFVVLDAPLLIEAGWASECDRIVFVDTPESLREQLAVQRGWSREELARRQAAQLPLEEKRLFATDVINNAGSLSELESQVDRFMLQVP
jgi:dephospho-CoA kinase